MNKKQKLKEFAEALAFTLYNTDEVKWPIRSKLAISSVGHFYAKEYMEQLRTFVQTYATSEWHRAFASSLSPLKASHHIIDGLEKVKVDKHEIAKDILRMIEVNNVLGEGTALNTDNHIILPNAEIEIINECYEQLKDEQELDALLKLSSLLWAYADAVYFQGREICCEYHGLYTLECGSKVLIRDYGNFNPTELWPDVTFRLEIRDVRIITFHQNDFSIVMDVYNNIHVLKRNFKESCIGGLLFVDGKIRGSDIIAGLTEVLLKELERQTRFVNSLSVKEIYQQYVYLFWYRKKYLADYLGLPWRPSEEVLNALEMKCTQNIGSLHKDRSMKALKKRYDYSAYID